MSRVIAPVVTRERDGQVARVVVGSGVRRNALTSGGWAGIELAVHALATDDTVRVAVLEGAAGWFCAGSDLREWAQASPEDVELSFARMEAACLAIEELPIPMVAKVRGPAAGAGCQLALACDMRIVAEGASIGMPISRLGILVSPSFALRLSVQANPAVAADLLYTGRMVGAAEAVRLGLANACVPGEALDDYVDAAVESILRSSDASIRAAKHSLRQLATPARVLARQMAGPSIHEDDFHSGVRAFLHRRQRRTVRLAQ